MHVQVAAIGRLETRYSCVFDANDLIVLTSLGNADFDLLVGQDAIDLNLASKSSLHHGDVGASVKVVSVALEELMRLDAARDDKIAGGGTANACFTESGNAKLLGVPDTSGDLDGNTLTIGDASLTLALGARILDDLAGASAVLARGS